MLMHAATRTHTHTQRHSSERHTNSGSISLFSPSSPLSFLHLSSSSFHHSPSSSASTFIHFYLFILSSPSTLSSPAPPLFTLSSHLPFQVPCLPFFTSNFTSHYFRPSSLNPLFFPPHPSLPCLSTHSVEHYFH